MVKLIVLIRPPEIERPGYFQEYNHFLMKVDHLPGMRRKAVSHVYAGPGGPGLYQSLVEAYFDTSADMQAALSSPEGVEAGTALLAFAGQESVTLFAEVQEENYPVT